MVDEAKVTRSIDLNGADHKLRIALFENNSTPGRWRIEVSSIEEDEGVSPTLWPRFAMREPLVYRIIDAVKDEWERDQRDG